MPINRNTFRPTSLHYKNSYGWAGSQKYNPRDVPGWRISNKRNREILEQQFAYEWFDYSSKLRGDRQGGPQSNPPFRSGAAGRLLPQLVQQNGQSAKVLRGFIRRAEYDRADPVSMARLYFMYNPEVIVRDYVSYLDQGALDPFNTVFEAGNLVAPPSFMDFTFDLFFDRLDEATAANNPGVYVDYEYFDLVVRNVIPTPHSRNNQLPDNGVMMVNPRDITVVFSPNLTVQGRPLNGRVAFERFTHRMVPTRMRISLTMRVVYIGPMRQMVEYKNEEFAASQTIPYDHLKPKHYDFTYNKMKVEDVTGVPKNGDSNDVRDRNWRTNKGIRQGVLDYVREQVGRAGTEYDLMNRDNVWAEADCSSLICYGYVENGWGEEMEFDDIPGTLTMIGRWTSSNWRTADKLWEGAGNLLNNLGKMAYGDIVIRNGHVAFFVDNGAPEGLYGDGYVRLFHARGEPYDPQVGLIAYDAGSSSLSDYTYGVRPVPAGRDSPTNTDGQTTRRNNNRYPDGSEPL